ncbi:transcriptional repressor [Taibaiella sp. KBW10]|uniref:Fur family transcriptional regulator n=1 Tax=Taibaiella sp. KBW10 TaxID=2153357 RepID=UPI000F5B59D4|nr:transcriptional repressor [Taibaiella sp. KBW10]RQO29638.1 transcriptional repressor [Taibaiella sp. KBW10]
MRQLISEKLKEKGLKITPQRIAIFEAVLQLKNHPTAEYIITYIKENYPNISVATVYKVLDTLTEHQLLKKVKTEKDIMRYDAIVDNHHHLYCTDTDKIEDYHDEAITRLLEDYFKNHPIKRFAIQDIKLQITGQFKK